MKILFVSRAYPPILGGIENQNYSIGKHLGKITPTKIIANTRGKSFLPFFLPCACIKILWGMRTHDALLLGDGVLSPLGAIAKFFYPKKRFFSIIHGLDITFAHQKSLMGKIYRSINIPCHKKLDALIMVGNETVNEAVKVGIPKERCHFVPNGISPEELINNSTRNDLEKLLDRQLQDKKVLLRVGRYVRHKGLVWFIQNVMQKLPEDVILVAAGGVPKSITGDGNIYDECTELVKGLHLEKRVFLLANVSWETIQILYNTCDLYISPNIKVYGTMEGFGINAIEAAVCGRVVLAANHEGLKDAIQDGKNGFLLEPSNDIIWKKKIETLLSDKSFRDVFGAQAQSYTRKHFSWEKIARKYLAIMKK